ncbi:MAG: tetratricopeptide repeat protein [Oscillospiraceae bacterium]|nr:tetratricopeptide repeat protein [Oscillospiraceae bacterium]
MPLLESKILSAKKFIQVFKESTENNQRFCFILGSGASVESGIPSGGILEMDWMDCLMGIRSDRGTAPMDANESERIAKNLFDEGAITHDFRSIKANWEEAKQKGWIAMSSEYYFDLFKLRFHPVQQNGYRYLESLMQKTEPSPGYRALALLLTRNHQHNLVITTNFDNLVEDALFLHTEWRPLVISHEALAEYIQFSTRRPIIVKVHRGLMYNPFNSPDTTDHLEKEWHEALDYAFKTYTPVVVGYGGGDGSLMTFLKNTTFPNGIYWCYREASGKPDEGIMKFLEEKNGCLVKTDGFDALMYSIGGSLYGDEVGIKKTRNHLEAQCRTRTNTYSKKWTELEKQTAATDTAKVVKAAELEAVKKRAKKDSLTYWDHFDLANAASERGDLDIAINEYILAIEKDPTRPEAYNNRGSVYSDLGQYEQAMLDFDKSIELGPNYPFAFSNRGNIYRILGRHELAIHEYDKAVELDPNYAAAFNNRGACYADMKQYERAFKDFNKAIELNPNDAFPYNNRGQTYLETQEYSKAIEDCKTALHMNPMFPECHHTLASVYYELGQYQDSISCFTTAIEQFIEMRPNSKELITTYKDRAKAHRALEKFDLAEADEAKAAELEAKENKDTP